MFDKSSFQNGIRWSNLGANVENLAKLPKFPTSKFFWRRVYCSLRLWVLLRYDVISRNRDCK